MALFYNEEAKLHALIESVLQGPVSRSLAPYALLKLDFLTSAYNKCIRLSESPGARAA